MPKNSALNNTIFICVGFTVGGLITLAINPDYDFSKAFHMCWGAGSMTAILKLNGLLKDA